MTSAAPMTSADNEPPTAALIDEVDRARALASMAMLSEWIANYHVERAIANTLPPRTAAERHLREHGHMLAFGCCREDVAGMEAA